jgi:hypothetical protein
MYALAVLFKQNGCAGMPHASLLRLGKGQKYEEIHLL